MTKPRTRTPGIYTVCRDGQPVAQAEAISQAEAVALWVASQQQPVLSAHLSTPREARELARLPLLSRSAPERDPRVSDLFDGSEAHLLPADLQTMEATYCPPVELGRVPLYLADTPAPEHVAEPEAMAQAAEDLFNSTDPGWLDAEAVEARKVQAFETGREIGRSGAKRFSAEMLQADVDATCNVRSRVDAGVIHEELIRGFDAGKKRGSLFQGPPKGAGKVAAMYRNPETGESWSGRGLKPKWLLFAIEGGKSLEDFLIPA